MAIGSAPLFECQVESSPPRSIDSHQPMAVPIPQVPVAENGRLAPPLATAHVSQDLESKTFPASHAFCRTRMSDPHNHQPRVCNIFASSMADTARPFIALGTSAETSSSTFGSL